METIGQRISRLRTAKDWTRPELGRQMGKAIGRKKPFAGELIRLYEEGINRPSPEARRALAKVFEKTEQYIEFGMSEEPRAHSAKQPVAAYGLSEEALEIARAFDQMQPQTKARIREHVFMYSVVDKSFPWLRTGRPVSETYGNFEKWHMDNMRTQLALEAARISGKGKK